MMECLVAAAPPQGALVKVRLFHHVARLVCDISSSQAKREGLGGSCNATAIAVQGDAEARDSSPCSPNNIAVVCALYALCTLGCGDRCVLAKHMQSCSTSLHITGAATSVA